MPSKELIETIKAHAAVCYLKLKKPTIYDFQDLFNEGIIVFLSCQDRYNKEIGSFEGFFKFCLKRRLGGIVYKSYRSINQETLDSNDTTILHKALPAKENDVSLFMLDDQLTQIEKEYLKFLLDPRLLFSEVFKINLTTLRKRIREELNIKSSHGRSIEMKIRSLLKSSI
jgi:hypothetical protein